MRFKISRVSSQKPDGPPPVEGAVRVDSENDIEPVWVVEINSLKELLALQERAGAGLIIDRSIWPGGEPEITIYDDYME